MNKRNKGRVRSLIPRKQLLKMYESGCNYKSISLESGLGVNKVKEIIKESKKNGKVYKSSAGNVF